MAFLAWSRGRIPVPECIYSHRVRNQVWAYIARVHCEAAGCPWVTKQPAVVSVPLWRYEPRTAEIHKRARLYGYLSLSCRRPFFRSGRWASEASRARTHAAPHTSRAARGHRHRSVQAQELGKRRRQAGGAAYSSWAAAGGLLVLLVAWRMSTNQHY